MVIESKRGRTAVEGLNGLDGSVEFVWVKSHSGIPDNGAMDQMAKDECCGFATCFKILH